MSDQAEQLRLKFMAQRQNTDKGRLARTTAVLSGKGGVGKSNFSLNLAISLAKSGRKVLLFDMDIGMGNIDILMGNHSKLTILDFFERGVPLTDIASEGPEQITVLAGGSGLSKLLTIDERLFERFTEELQQLLGRYDDVLFDMGAGINQESSRFLLCVDELIVLTTPEPTAVMDAYSMMKYLAGMDKTVPFYLVCNRARGRKEGQETAQRLKQAVKKFLDKDLQVLGILPDDRTVPKAVTKQVPFILFDSHAEVSKALRDIASSYISGTLEAAAGRSSNFLESLRRYFLGKQGQK